MLRIPLLAAALALLILPEAMSQPRPAARPSTQLIGDLAFSALRTHRSDRFEMPEIRRIIRADNYARVQEIRRRIRENTLTLDESLRQLVQDGALTATDAQLFRRLAEQEDAAGAKRIGTLMIDSPNDIVGATGAIVLQMVNEPEDALSNTQAQSGGAGAQIGAGLENINWGDVAGDAAKGALVGGLIGGSVGAAIGAAIGGIASAVGDFLSGFFGGGEEGAGEEGGGDTGGGDSGGGSGGGDGLPAPTPSPVPIP